MSTDTETLAAALRRLLRRGLPVDPAAAGSELLDLPGVVARAHGSNDPAVRAHALDGVLRGQLARFPHAPLAPAARLLFGAVPATAGRTLTARRTEAARAADYEVHHFRKHIESRICTLLAEQLLADAQAFAAAHVAAPRLSPQAGSLRLPPDVFAWEIAEHEEALCEVWSRLYALRAALLRTARLASMDAAVPSAVADEVLWCYAVLRAAVQRYRAAYGPLLLPADTASVTPADLEKLAGPLPELSPTDLVLLSVLPPTADPQAFTTQLNESSGGAQIRAAWHQALTKQLTDTTARRTA
ncbi:hypothetical protein [Streptomyces griseomycini]|uniref:Uncharacterized protein n=1 Tax=Streptomyces griseomycini TaxID=66895 RepID=A0A7W7PXZ0_9ACTN|nr:hypothetical protein [Streptomyces griseomycini]MBB4903288.1 hypothetical protein [Streptomyces griseomycini]GGR43744.1 hypothetical protein GCM10015536_57130 [Streptomyces griseomycini]